MAYLTKRSVNPRQTLINELRKSTSFFELLKNSLEEEAFINGIKVSIDNINIMIDILENENLKGIDKIIKQAQIKKRNR